VICDQKVVSVEEVDKKVIDINSPSFQALFRAAMLCNNTIFNDTQKLIPDSYRNPHDKISYGYYRYFHTLPNVTQILEGYPRIRIIQMDNIFISVHSTEKRENNGYLLLITGNTETILKSCNTYLHEGKEKRLDDSAIKALTGFAKKLILEGEIVNSFCQAYVDIARVNLSAKPPSIPMENYCFLGSLSLSDVIYENVPESILELSRMSLRLIMTSSEDFNSTKSIAKKIGYLTFDLTEDLATQKGVQPSEINQKDVHSVIAPGSLLNELNSNELDDILLKKQVLFSNVTAKQKAFLVEALKRRGDIVSLCADNSDDTLALEKSDVGICYGNGSAVSKDASQFIIVDDNFTNILRAFQMGRSMPSIIEGGKSKEQACIIQ